MAVQNRRLFHLQYSLKEYGAHQSMRSAVCLRVDQSTHNSVVYWLYKASMWRKITSMTTIWNDIHFIFKFRFIYIIQIFTGCEYSLALELFFDTYRREWTAHERPRQRRRRWQIRQRAHIRRHLKSRPFWYWRCRNRRHRLPPWRCCCRWNGRTHNSSYDFFSTEFQPLFPLDAR